MTKSDQNNEQLSAVLMLQYGIEMCVLTPHSNLEAIENQLSSSKRWSAGNPKRHRFAFERIRARLVGEDNYFTENPLGSGLIDHIQKITVAAMQIADMKVCAHRS